VVVALAALRRYGIAVFVFLLTVVVFVARYEPASPVVAPVGVPGSWTPTFADEFDGAALDTTRWSTGWFGDGVTGPVRTTEPACYDPAQVQLPGDGTLHIALVGKAQTCSGTVRPWSTGLITTNGKFSYTYGAAEARMYLPADGSGQPINWPAFWANGQNWPYDGENDIVESESGSTGPHFHSADGDFGFAVPGDWAGWHTFGSVWEPGRVTYYYDGRMVGSLTEGITSSPMYLVLGFGPAHEAVTTPGRLRVDYVRVWQRAS
jgi:beta-glucanase (GH16 family)